MRKLRFTASNHEWHLVDDKGNILHNMVDQYDNLFNEDGKHLTLKEIENLCASDLHCADNYYSDNEPYNGVFLEEPLSEQEIIEASKIMARTFYDVYFG